MAAAQLGTTASDFIAADPDNWREVEIVNLGPNVIYVNIGVAAATATGLQIAATSGTKRFRLPPGQAVSGIAATAAQASPADTRYLAI